MAALRKAAGTRRAVVVSPNPTSGAGGAERLCAQLAEFLRRLGFEVAMVGPGGPGPRWLATQGGTFPWQAVHLRREIRRIDPPPDLVVTVGPFGWPGGGRPTRVHVYVSNLARLARYQSGRWHWRVRWGLAAGLCEALASRGATAVAISEQAAEDARRLYRARVRAVVAPGVDTDLFCPRPRDAARRRFGLEPDRRYGLFAGRNEPAKGQDIALAACRRVGWQLLAAGPQPMDGCLALGTLDDEGLAWAYAAADAVVLPTAYEGFGYVAVEAVAAGIPVVTPPVGWARELGRAVPAYEPLLVRRDVAAVSSALDAVAAGAATAAVAEARQFVLRQHTLAAFERRWLDLVASVAVGEA